MNSVHGKLKNESTIALGLKEGIGLFGTKAGKGMEEKQKNLRWELEKDEKV